MELVSEGTLENVGDLVAAERDAVIVFVDVDEAEDVAVAEAVEEAEEEEESESEREGVLETEAVAEWHVL